MVIAKVGAGGSINIYNSAGNTHVVADVVGYFSDAGQRFVPVDPARIVDTRDGTGGRAAPLGDGEAMPIGAAGVGPVPSGASGVVVNVTSTESTAPSYVTMWPVGLPQPFASTLNPRPGVDVPNQAYLRTGTGGGLGGFNAHGSTQLVIDVFGYFV
jgi:hypothetical protein